MKIRQGFVSNSSSCSFIIPKKFLTEQQLDLIRNHKTSGEKYANHWPWEIKESNNVIKGESLMAGFDFLAYLEKIGVKREHIKFEDHSL